AIGVSRAGLALCLAGLALAASAWPPLVMLGGFVVGLGYGPTTPASSVILVRAAPPGMFALVFSVKQTGVPAGGVLAGALAPGLIYLLGWQGAPLALGSPCPSFGAAVVPARPRHAPR